MGGLRKQEETDRKVQKHCRNNRGSAETAQKQISNCPKKGIGNVAPKFQKWKVTFLDHGGD